MGDVGENDQTLSNKIKEIVGSDKIYRDRLGHQWVSEMMLNAQSIM